MSLIPPTDGAITKLTKWELWEFFGICEEKIVPPFFYKHSIFDPLPENCLSFSKKLPKKIV